MKAFLKYNSYADCDEDFLRRILPKNLSPFWAVRNISKATTNLMKKDLKYSYGKLYGLLGMILKHFF